MEILQAYYTSCKYGQSGSGFQFYSYSEGLSSDELDEIASFVDYVAPTNLPTNPSPEEIERDFPVAFSYFRLASGRVGVVQSVALNHDYTGRPGNFFAHVLILKDGEFPFLPIKLYKSESLRRNLSQQEWAIEEIPPKLPVLNVSDLELNDQITNSHNISQFLQVGNRAKQLSKMIDAYLQQQRYSKKMVIVDSNTPEWIAAITASFPRHISKKQSFSTYNINPTPLNVQITSTSYDGSYFDFRDHQVFEHQYYIFNINEDLISPVESESSFAKVTAENLKNSPQLVSEFSDFISKFEISDFAREIEIISALYFFSVRFLMNNWSLVVSYVGSHANREYKASFIKNNLELIGKVIMNSKPDEVNEILQVLDANIPPGSADVNVYFDLYRYVYLSSIESSKDLSEILQLNEKLLQFLSKLNGLNLRNLFLSKEHIENLFAFGSPARTLNWVIALGMSFQYCKTNKVHINELFTHEPLIDCLGFLSGNNSNINTEWIDLLLLAVKDELATLIDYLYANKCENLALKFSKVYISKSSKDDVNAFMKHLSVKYENQKLYHNSLESYFAFLKANHLSSQAILQEIQKFTKDPKVHEAAMSYFKMLDSEPNADLLIQIYSYPFEIDPKYKLETLKLFDKNLLTKPVTIEQCSFVKKLADRNGYASINVLAMGIDVQQKVVGIEYVSGLWTEYSKTLDKEKAKNFLNWIFTDLLALISSKEDAGDFLEIFKNQMDLFNVRLKEEKYSRQLCILLEYVLGNEHLLMFTNEESIVACLKAFSKSEFKRFELEMSNIKDSSLAVQDIFKKANRHGFIGKLKDLFIN
ncbi:GAP1-N2 domain-containing protein [Marinifilum fragile]|uniref:GAP1-N2 domain-containing protein n=1 Tax=Marinifilum fragile TaxID=570161 RepID=UPI0006D01889|nr:hypothetical protein [Marinifilum fragile]